MTRYPRVRVSPQGRRAMVRMAVMMLVVYAAVSTCVIVACL